MDFIYRARKPFILGAVLGILFALSLTIVAPDKRAVIVTLGKIGDDVLQPGFYFRWPIISQVKRYSVAPNTYDLKVAVNDMGAISRDNQIIGVDSKIVWNYNVEQIKTIVEKFPDRDSLEQIINNTAFEALKTEVGKYTIFELAMSMPRISAGAFLNLKTKLENYPIVVQQFNITNFNWSSEFDKQVNATMAMEQQVKKAKAEAERTEQEQRALSITAEAAARAQIAEADGERQALLLKADGEKQAAILRADAQRAKGRGIADYNNLVAQKADLEIRFRQLEIERLKIERWDGRYVSTYIPMPANGAIVSLPGVQTQTR